MIKIKKINSKQFLEAILIILLIGCIPRNKNTSFEGQEIVILNETLINNELKISKILIINPITIKAKTINFLILSDSKSC